MVRYNREVYFCHTTHSMKWDMLLLKTEQFVFLVPKHESCSKIERFDFQLSQIAWGTSYADWVKVGVLGTSPSETRGTHLIVTRGTHCHPGHPHPDISIKHTWRAFPIRTASRKSKRRLQNIDIRTASINVSAP